MSDNDLIRRGDAIAAIPANAAANTLGPCGGARLNAVLALRALPAVQVTVKPLEWEPIGILFHAFDPLFETVAISETPDVYDSERAARIRSALAVTPAPDAAKVEALAEAACGLLDAYSAIIGPGNPWGDSLRAAIAAMKEG